MYHARDRATGSVREKCVNDAVSPTRGAAFEAIFQIGDRRSRYLIHNFHHLVLENLLRFSWSILLLRPLGTVTESTINDALSKLVAENATSRFLEQGRQEMEAESHRAENEIVEEEREEREYQMAIAASLGIPYTMPDTAGPDPHRSSSLLHNAVTGLNPPFLLHDDPNPPMSSSYNPSSSFSRTPPVIQTVPYQPPNITQHMNKSWMRPTVDNTKKTRTVNRGDLDNHFVLVFWGQVDRIFFRYLFCF